jgi:hypothetical protein
VQAVIFQNQLTVAREQLVSSSRAFVVFAGLNAFAFNSPGDGLLKWNIAPIIENSGNTPTVGLKAKATSCFRKDDLPRDFSFPDPATESVPIVLGPRQKSALGSFEIPGVFLPQIEAGTAKVYIYGWGTYADIIKKWDDHHITKFCYLLNKFRGRPDDANSRIGYAPCWTHNCADAECDDQNTARANSEGQTDKVSCTVSVVIENR